MSGFFKKLFNRITGKGNETSAPVEEVAVPQIEAPKPVAPEIPEVVVEAKPEPALKEIEVPEPVIKKAEAKKPKPKKPEPKAKAKPEPKKVEVKKPEPKAKAKPEPKKPEAKKPEAPKPAPKKPEPIKPEPKKPEPEKIVVKPAPSKVAAPPPPPPVVEKQPEPVVLPPVVQPPAPTPEPEPAPRRGWLSRLTQGLSKSSKSITTSITSIFTKRKLDAATLEELEDVLIQADLGIAVSERIIKAVSAGRYDREIEPEEVKRILAEEVAKVLKPVEVP